MHQQTGFNQPYSVELKGCYGSGVCLGLIAP
jgi:hypothetical protein